MNYIKLFSKKTSIFILLTTLIIINFIVFLTLTTNQKLYTLLIASTSLLFSIPLVLLINDYFKGKRIIKAIYIISILFLLNYPLRAIYLIWKGYGLLSLYAFPQEHIKALGLAFVGGISFLTAYYLYKPKEKKINFISKDWNKEKFNKTLNLLYITTAIIAVLVIAIIKGYLPTQLTIKSMFLVLFTTLIPIITILTFIKKFYFKKNIRIFWTIIFPLQIITGFLIRSKELIVISIIYLFIFIIMQKKRIDYRIIIVGIIIFLMALTLIPPLRKNELTQLTQPDYLKETIINTLDYPMGRMHALDSTAVIIKKTPSEKEFKHGKTLLLLPYSFMPRLFWKNKPIIPLGHYFAKEYANRTNHIAIGTSLIGDLYWNFGIISVILGMAILGLLIKKTSSILETEKLTPSKTLILAPIYYYLIIDFMLESLAAALSGLIKTIIVMLLLISYFNKKPQKNTKTDTKIKFQNK